MPLESRSSLARSPESALLLSLAMCSRVYVLECMYKIREPSIERGQQCANTFDSLYVCGSSKIYSHSVVSRSLFCCQCLLSTQTHQYTRSRFISWRIRSAELCECIRIFISWRVYVCLCVCVCLSFVLASQRERERASGEWKWKSVLFFISLLTWTCVCFVLLIKCWTCKFYNSEWDSGGKFEAPSFPNKWWFFGIREVKNMPKRT